MRQYIKNGFKLFQVFLGYQNNLYTFEVRKTVHLKNVWIYGSMFNCRGLLYSPTDASTFYTLALNAAALNAAAASDPYKAASLARNPAAANFQLSAAAAAQLQQMIQPTSYLTG